MVHSIRLRCVALLAVLVAACGEVSGTPGGDDDPPPPGTGVDPSDIDNPVEPVIGPWAVTSRLRGLVSIDLTSDGRYAIVAARKDHSIAILDLAQRPFRVVNVDRAAGIGWRPIRIRTIGSLALVVNEYDTKLNIVDPALGKVVSTVKVPMYCQDVVWDPQRSRYYVSNTWSGSVLVYDASWTRIAPATGILVGRYPGAMTIGPDGRLYVGNRGSWDVSVVDLDANLEVDRVHLGSRPERLAATATRVLVTNHGGATLDRVNDIPLVVNDQVDIQNVVTEIDPESLATRDLYVDRGADYLGIDVADGLVAFAGAASGSVHVDDGVALQTVDLLADGTLPGGFAPSGLRIFTNTRDVAIRSSQQVFAVNYLRSTVVELAIREGRFRVIGETALASAGVPIQAFQPAPAVNFTREENGERYWNTLSAWFRGQRDFTCATCHTDGASDLRLTFTSITDPNDPAGAIQGPERHPSLIASGTTAPYAWEASFATLDAFNRDALDRHDVPPMNSSMIHNDVASFMVDFEKSLVPGPNPNRPPSDSLGATLFTGIAGCAGCHSGPDLTDRKLHAVGTGRVVDTPSLRGIWLREPYLHDGRAADLASILDPATYDNGAPAMGNPAVLSMSDKAALIAYLRAQ